MSLPLAPRLNPLNTLIGDMIEITTPQGFAYAQFTHDIPLHGQLLRILPGLYATRLTDLTALVQQRERYVTFFRLRPALYKARAVVAIVGTCAIPARNRPVPLFRSPALEPREPGPPPYWTLWDGQRRWRVDQLTAEQWDLPVDGMPHTEVFLDQIVSGWQPRDYDGIPVDRTPPVATDRSTRRPRQRRKRRLPRIGDVVEIATPQGFAYAQLTHDIPLEGELLRILPGLYASRPTDLAALVQQRERYVSFYPLRLALRSHYVTVVGGCEVPEVAIVGPFAIPARNRPVPLFRAIGGPGRHPVTGKINCWWLWDEERRWRVEGLTEKQRDLPVDGTPSHPDFIDNIVSGWAPRDWPEPRKPVDLKEAPADEPPAEPAAPEPPAAAPPPPMRHFLYFPSAAAAQRAARQLRAAGYAQVAVRPPDSACFEEEDPPPGTRPLDRKWGVVANGDVPPPGVPFGDTREHLEALAESLGGEYDGWELAVRN